jgi:hypothetical protein
MQIKEEVGRIARIEIEWIEKEDGNERNLNE